MNNIVRIDNNTIPINPINFKNQNRKQDEERNNINIETEDWIKNIIFSQKKTTS